MASSGFLEKWIGVCRRRTRFYSQLNEEENSPESDTRIEEIDEPLQIVVEILPKDKPGSGIERLSNNTQKWYERGLRITKARLVNLGFGCLQKCVGACRSRIKGYFYREDEQDEPEFETKSREDEFRSETRSLPDEMVVEILTRVPFKTLLRCRCVCKTWRSLVSQPSFIKMQLLKNHSTTANDDDSDEVSDYVMFSNKEIGSSGFSFHSLYGHGCVTKRLPFPLKPSVGFRHFVPSGAENFRPFCPFLNKISFLQFEVVGSCNGLLCLLSRWDRVMLWNPSINKMRVIEKTQRYHLGLVGGLCFIPQTTDFKVVAICHEYCDKSPTVQIFSTSANSWKMVEHNDSRRWVIHQKCPSPFVGGALHWCAHRNWRVQVILCFDVFEEEFREIDVPTDKEITRITEFQGTIACFLDDPNNQSWEVWVMKEYGAEESWTKLYTVGYVHGNPLEIMNNGEVMLTSANGLFFLFEQTTESQRREVEVKPGCHDIIAYKGSLALLNEGNQSKFCLFCGFMLIVILLQCIGPIVAFLTFCLSD